MKHLINFSALVVSGLFLVMVNASAADHTVVTPMAAASQSASNAKPGKAPAPKSKPTAAKKLVDINSASLKELKTLDGIGDAEAQKIIANRPFGSKAWLVSDQIIDEAVYQAIRHSIIAKQPYKDGAKNAALYKNRPVK